MEPTAMDVMTWINTLGMLALWVYLAWGRVERMVRTPEFEVGESGDVVRARDRKFDVEYSILEAWCKKYLKEPYVLEKGWIETSPYKAKLVIGDPETGAHFFWYSGTIKDAISDIKRWQGRPLTGQVMMASATAGGMHQIKVGDSVEVIEKDLSATFGHVGTVYSVDGNICEVSFGANIAMRKYLKDSLKVVGRQGKI